MIRLIGYFLYLWTIETLVVCRTFYCWCLENLVRLAFQICFCKFKNLPVMQNSLCFTSFVTVSECSNFTLRAPCHPVQFFILNLAKTQIRNARMLVCVYLDIKRLFTVALIFKKCTLCNIRTKTNKSYP